MILSKEKKKIPEDVERFLKKEGLDLGKLAESMKAHKERMKRLDFQLSAVRAERQMMGE